MIPLLKVNSFLKRNWRKVVFSIVLFWIIFATLILIEDEVANRISKMPHDPVDRIQYILRFAIWIVLTPVIMWITMKIPLRQSSLVKVISLHVLFALSITFLEFCIEIPIIRHIKGQISGPAPPVLDYAAVFILKLNIYLLLYFFVALMTYLVLYFDNLNQSKMQASEAELKNQQLLLQLGEAKLNLLKMQLDPHFLFNTHHAIISLMMNQENEKAILMLNKLSEMLRLSLDERQQTVVLEQEIRVLKLYLDIQQIRFESRLTIDFDLDPATLSKQVPSFILQPLVENAIKYGISKIAGHGFIRISSALQNSLLMLRVENEGGNGISETYIPGIGITNTRERLYQLYADKASFELKNLGGKKVSATITIPMAT